MPSKRVATSIPAPRERLGFLLYRVGVQVSRAYSDLIRPLGFSPVEIGLLTHLASGGEDHVRAIARTLGVSPQTIVNVTTSLHSRGIVRRSRSGPDQRIVKIDLSEEGRRAVVEVDAIVQVLDQEIVKHLSKREADQLTRGLKKLLVKKNG